MKTVAETLLPLTKHSQRYAYVQSEDGLMNFIRLNDGYSVVVFNDSTLLAYLQVRRDEIEQVMNFLTLIRGA